MFFCDVAMFTMQRYSVWWYHHHHHRHYYYYYFAVLKLLSLSPVLYMCTLKWFFLFCDLPNFRFRRRRWRPFFMGRISQKVSRKGSSKRNLQTCKFDLDVDVLWCSGQALSWIFNPLSPNTEENKSSSYTITTCWNIQVMRINEGPGGKRA